MRREPLRLESYLPLDCISTAQRMKELEMPRRRFVKDYELPIWWTTLGILVTAILLILWGKL